MIKFFEKVFPINKKMIPIVSGYVDSNYPIGRVCISLLNSRNFKYKLIGVSKKNLSNFSTPKKIIIFLIRYIKYFFVFLKYIRSPVLIIVAPFKLDIFTLFVAAIFCKKIAWLHMDNSFFCTSEYNFNYSFPGECFECLKNSEAYKTYKCKNPKMNLLLFRLYKPVMRLFFLRSKNNLIHLCQSQNSLELIELYEKKIGTFHRAEVIGLITTDISIIKEANIRNPNLEKKCQILRKKYKYIFTFHGSKLGTKGAFHILEIAKNMPNSVFILPFKKESFIEELVNMKNKQITFDFNQKNIIYYDLNTTNGLINLLDLSDAQFVLSSWSAPIEIAMIKSLQLKSPVISFFTSEFNTTSSIHKNFINKFKKGIQFNYPTDRKDYSLIAKKIYDYLKINNIEEIRKYTPLEDMDLLCENNEEYAKIIYELF